MFRFGLIFFWSLLCCNIYAQQLFTQLQLKTLSDAKKVCIAINPANAAQVIMGNDESGFSISNDTGRTWQSSGVFCGSHIARYKNPFVFWHSNQPYYLYQPGRDTAMVVTADNSGRPYCYMLKGNAHKIMDRLRICADEKSGLLHGVYTEFGSDSSIIFYVRSLDDGKTWSAPSRISTAAGDVHNSDSTLKGPVICTGNGKNVYVFWAGANGLMFRASPNNGATWPEPEKQIATLKGGWNYSTGNNNGNGLPTVACDQGGGQFNGRLYVCWSDEKHGANNKDVFMAYSDDQGANWTDPILLTYRPNHKNQFMPYMTVDQTTGYVYVLYYDGQNQLDGPDSDVYLALSKNGGLKFDQYNISYPPLHLPYSDTWGLSVVNGVARAVWLQKYKDGYIVFMALVDDKALAHYNSLYSDDVVFLERSVPFAKKIKIRVSSNGRRYVHGTITKPLEPGFEKPALLKLVKKGNNRLLIDTKKLGLQKGNYVLTLYAGWKNTFIWILDE